MNNLNNNLMINKSQSALADTYLKFQLNEFTYAALPVKYLHEVVVVPVESIPSIPNMPACVLGLINWRSRIIWVIDLPNMLNLEAIGRICRQHKILVIQTESTALALVVPEIIGTTRIVSDDIKSPQEKFSSDLLPYLRGWVLQNQEQLVVLDIQAILQSAIFHNN